MKTGVYQIKNKINNKVYIGSSARNIEERWIKHKYLLRNNRHINKYLQNSWNKYGEENFEFTILEFSSREKCIELEQYYMDNLKPTYNRNPTAGSSLGKIHSEETKQKIREKALGRISCRKGVKLSDETRKKISDTRKKDTLHHYDCNNNLLAIYPSVLDASKALDISRNTLYDLIHKKRRFLRTKYKNDIFKIIKYENESCIS